MATAFLALTPIFSSTKPSAPKICTTTTTPPLTFHHDDQNTNKQSTFVLKKRDLLKGLTSAAVLPLTLLRDPPQSMAREVEVGAYLPPSQSDPSFVLFKATAEDTPALRAGTFAEEDLKMESMVDNVNAYTYLYPMELPSKKFRFKWVESRKPERYSSAAPLSPDARLRIVSERVDIIDNLIISVAIGPPNFKVMKTQEKSTWTAKDVADSVLSDKSVLRVTSSQRLEESSVLDTHESEIDGEPYWYYEYLVRKSPTKTAQEPKLYRHYIASTVERDGYFYTLSASTLNKQWDMMGPFLEKTVNSFRLLPPTNDYVPPFKDPWRFW